jgi:CheY-like chemotaxis protein
MRYILLVDDNEAFAKAFAHLLGTLSGLKLEILTVGSLAQAHECLAEGGLDGTLVDLGLLDGDRLCLLEEMSSAIPKLPSLALTEAIEPEMLARALEAGAAKMLDKLSPLEVMSEAIKRLWEY